MNAVEAFDEEGIRSFPETRLSMKRSNDYLYLSIFDGMWLALGVANLEIDEQCMYHFFSIDSRIKYHSFCLDFGPMNLSALWHFREILHLENSCAGANKLALFTEDTSTSVTNAVLLLGSYMIIELGQDPATVKKTFAPIANRLQAYRDILPGPQTFDLTVVDCWEALHRAKSLSWIDFSPDGFDCEEYEHFDSPLNADLHIVVPNKIVAMKGPVALPNGAQYEDLPCGGRNFSPSHYAEILADLDVKLVVRLNEPKYTASEFERRGIAVADLFFEDCSVPPDDVVVKFLLMLENLPGAAAVHCKAGLGRTGTLVALFLMKNFGFTARQAIAWLRLVRPGSVIGSQQHYVCSMEGKIARLRGHPMSGPYAAGQAAAAAAAAAALHGGRAAGPDLTAVRAVVDRVVRQVEQGKRRGSLHRLPSSTSSPAEARASDDSDAPPQGRTHWQSVRVTRTGKHWQSATHSASLKDLRPSASTTATASDDSDATRQHWQPVARKHWQSVNRSASLKDLRSSLDSSAAAEAAAHVTAVHARRNSFRCLLSTAAAATTTPAVPTVTVATPQAEANMRPDAAASSVASSGSEQAPPPPPPPHLVRSRSMPGLDKLAAAAADAPAADAAVGGGSCIVS